VPRPVDHDERRRQIARAALKLLSSKGPEGLSMRAVARELGGSLTVVTHYYSTRRELLLDLPQQLAQDWSEDLSELEAQAATPRARLRTLLAWLLPLDRDGLQEEMARFSLLVASTDADSSEALAGFDDYVRELLRQHVTGLVPDDAVESSVELFRAFTNGIVVNAVMDPVGWPASRQEALLDLAIGLILPNEGLPE
jgi:AcrR family transcriptional regulator